LTYEKHIEILKKQNLPIPNSDIYEFDSSPISDIFQSYFDFSYKAIQKFCADFSIKEYFFYFGNTFSSNAGADCKNNIHVIRVTNALINNLHNQFVENDNLKDLLLKKSNYKVLQNNISYPIEKLFLQCSLTFTTYHELTHFLHKSNGVLNFHETPRKCEFDLEKHLFEFDADLNGAQFVSFYLIELYVRIPKKVNIEPEIIFSIGTGSLLLTFLLFFNREFSYDKNIEEFYLKENSHPHSLIRIHYILNHFYNICSANNIELDLQKLLNYSFDIVFKFFPYDSYKRFKNIYYEDFDKIDEYSNFLFGQSIKNKKLLINNINKLSS